MGGSSVGVAVIGAGMAGRAHAHGYRAAAGVFGTDLPPVRLVAVADAYDAVRDGHGAAVWVRAGRDVVEGDRRRSGC